MEGSTKDFARSVWRSSQRKKGRGRGAPSSKRHEADSGLGSNQFRYGEDTDVEEPGQVLRVSKGADLAELLEQARAQDEETLFRHRALLDEEADDMRLPPMGDTQQVLEVDFAAIADTLAHLPLHQLLGISPELFGSNTVQAPNAASSSSPQLASQLPGIRPAATAAAAGGAEGSRAIGSNVSAVDLHSAPKGAELNTTATAQNDQADTLAASCVRHPMLACSNDLDSLLSGLGLAPSSKPTAQGIEDAHGRCQPASSVPHEVSGTLETAALIGAKRDDLEDLDYFLSDLAVASSSGQPPSKAAEGSIGGNPATTTSQAGRRYDDADLDDLLEGVSSVSGRSYMQPESSRLGRPKSTSGSRIAEAKRAPGQDVLQDNWTSTEEKTLVQSSAKGSDSLESWLANL